MRDSVKHVAISCAVHASYSKDVCEQYDVICGPLQWMTQPHQPRNSTETGWRKSDMTTVAAGSGETV